jgi:hypothetical protein
MKKFIVVILIAIFCFPMLAMARRDTGPPEWTFDNVADLGDWRDNHDLATLTTITKIKSSNGVERNVLRISLTGDKPYVYPGGAVASWEPFNGYENGAIYIGVKVERPDVWQIDYITGKNTEYNERQSKTFPVNATTDFIDLKFDMQWDGMIRGFKIHLGSKNKIIDMDYVSLTGPITASQPPKKLATTWGKVKDLF